MVREILQVIDHALADDCELCSGVGNQIPGDANLLSDRVNSPGSFEMPSNRWNRGDAAKHA